MLKVFFTVDTEIWCDGWSDLDAKFADSYRRYVYGPTPEGDYGMPHLLSMLTDHGLTGIFFVEPLFAGRFGLDPLRELVALIKNSGHEVQLHLHTEWADEAKRRILPDVTEKRQLLRQFSRTEQTRLLAAGLQFLSDAGASSINAFRAGNFALNEDTLHAVRANGLEIDSSYNAGSFAGVADVAPGEIINQPRELAGIREYPVTVFYDRGKDHLRPLHLTACSFSEMQYVLNTASEGGWDSVVLVAHNFELLNSEKTRRDRVMIRRFSKLCRFLEQNADRFSVRGFRDLEIEKKDSIQFEPIRSPIWMTGQRMVEQLTRRLS